METEIQVIRACELPKGETWVPLIPMPITKLSSQLIKATPLLPLPATPGWGSERPLQVSEGNVLIMTEPRFLEPRWTMRAYDGRTGEFLRETPVYVRGRSADFPWWKGRDRFLAGPRYGTGSAVAFVETIAGNSTEEKKTLIFYFDPFRQEKADPFDLDGLVPGFIFNVQDMKQDGWVVKGNILLLLSTFPHHSASEETSSVAEPYSPEIIAIDMNGRRLLWRKKITLPNPLLDPDRKPDPYYWGYRLNAIPSSDCIRLRYGKRTDSEAILGGKSLDRNDSPLNQLLFDLPSGVLLDQSRPDMASPLSWVMATTKKDFVCQDRDSVYLIDRSNFEKKRVHRLPRNVLRLRPYLGKNVWVFASIAEEAHELKPIVLLDFFDPDLKKYRGHLSVGYPFPLTVSDWEGTLHISDLRAFADGHRLIIHELGESVVMGPFYGVLKSATEEKATSGYIYVFIDPKACKMTSLSVVSAEELVEYCYDAVDFEDSIWIVSSGQVLTIKVR